MTNCRDSNAFIRGIRILIAVPLVLSSCGLANGDSCDPIGSDVDPVPLGEILEIGQWPRDLSHILMVARTPKGQFQVFQTVDGEALKRRPVYQVQEVAAASRPGYSMRFGEGADDQQLRLEFDPSGSVTVMSVGESVLNLIGRELPAGIAFQRSPRKFVIAGYGFLEDAGNTTAILVRPDIDWSNEEFRVFFGHASSLVERMPASVVSFGSSLRASFKAHGHEVKATVLVLTPGDPAVSFPSLSIDGLPQLLLSPGPRYNRRPYSIVCGQDVAQP
jgi:hypothetical protein